MSEDDTLKTIRIVAFSGKPEDWNRWSKTFLAVTTARGMREVIKPTKPEEDQDEDQNDRVYSELMLACRDDVTFGIIEESISENFPEGDARIAWKKLCDKFEPKSGMMKVQLKSEFQQSKLVNMEDDPDVWINKLELIRRRLKVLKISIEDDDMILHILNNLPKEYATTIEICEEDLSINKLDLETLRARLRSKYQRYQREKTESKTEPVALIGQRQYKGLGCNHCGKPGHASKDCWELEENKKKKEEYQKKRQGNNNNGGNNNNHNNNGNNNRNNNRFQQNNNNNNRRNWNGPRCFNCNQLGHKADRCDQPKKNDNNNNKDGNKVAMRAVNKDFILMGMGENGKIKSNTWILDSGASGHMTNSLEGFITLKPEQRRITVGNGTKMAVVQSGSWKGMFKNTKGEYQPIVLQPVGYVPELICSLFSMTTALSENWKSKGNKNGITLMKDSIEITFGKRVDSVLGFLFSAEFMTSNNMAMVSLKQNKTMTYKQAHLILGHIGEDKVRATAAKFGWNLTTNNCICEGCAITKAKQKNMNREAENKSTTPGERLMIDTSSIKDPKGKETGKFWLLIVDKATDMKWSYFIKNKDNQVSIIVEFIKHQRHLHPKAGTFICCDNAGENLTLEKECKREGLGVQFEFTSRYTPQQNGKVERSFATLFGRMRAMMITAGLDQDKRYELWTEAASTATKLSNKVVDNKNNKSAQEKYYGKKEKSDANKLKSFGELGIVTDKPGAGIKNKLSNRGRICMFVGYAKGHAENVYQMYNLQTKKILLTRDIIWTKRFYGSQKGKTSTQFFIKIELEEKKKQNQIEETVSHGTEEINFVNKANDNSLDKLDMAHQELMNVRFEKDKTKEKLGRELRGLRSYNNPGRLELEDQALFCFNVIDDKGEQEEPATFQEAWYHNDPVEREKWRQSIRLEFRQMIRNGVWRNKGTNSLPANRKGIGTKWVFKKKKNGVYRSRLVAKGYDQIAGVDFQYNFAPVTSEVTLRILLVTWIVNNLFAEIADVQTAFLHGDLEEEIFIKIPPGYKEFLAETNETIDEQFLKLEKSTYGLVQAARS